MLKIYKASAGSGKTYTLTREYIKFLIGEKLDDGTYRLRRKGQGMHRHILAITYTNKATEEMTRRIIKELAILAQLPTMNARKSDFLDYFIAELKCTPEELAEASRRALYDLLGDYNYFNVSTIDAFFQSVLRIFTREVEVPDNFDVELNNRYTVQLGVGEMFNSINYRQPLDPIKEKEHKWLTEWLTRYMKSLMDSGKVFNLFSKSSYIYSDIVDTFDSLMDETFKLNLKVMQDYFSDRQRIIRFEASLDRVVDNEFALLRGNAVRVTQLADPSQLYVHLRKPMLRWVDGDPVIPGGNTVIAAATDIGKRYIKAVADRGGISPDVDNAIIDMSRQFRRFVSVKEACTRIRSTIYQLGLLGALIDFIDEYCRDNNMLLLSETNSLLREIINDDETPFIYEKLGYYLNHFLIDEFQDTSPMQWDNLRPLVSESMSRGCDDLIIGDEKQCIYRFRNSDPELLSRHVGNQIAARFSPDNVAVRGTDITDNNNWRSAPEIVMFNNTLFTGLAAEVDRRAGASSDNHDAISARDTYSNIVQQIPGRNAGLKGYVKVAFVPPADESGDDNTTETTDDDSDNRNDAFALDFMTAELRRQLTVGGYSPRDIAILVRSHVNGEKVINHLLREMDRPDSGLPRFDIMSSDAMSVGSSPTVRLIISILRLVNIPELLDSDHAPVSDSQQPRRRSNPAHRRARLVNRYERYLHTDNPATGVHYTPSEALAAALDDEETTTETTDDSRDTGSVTAMSCPNLPSIIERIIARYVPEGALADDNIFVTAFQDIVLDYCSRGDHDIRSFLAWWDKTGAQSKISSPPDLNALTVMTIHQSKGLEFPCVHIPFATGDLLKYRGFFWHPLDPGDFSGVDPDCVPPMVPLAITSKLSEVDMFAHEFNDYCSRQRIDELNVNYVAFTRATTELIVCSNTDEGRYNERFGLYLRDAINHMSESYIDSSASGIDTTRRPYVMPLDTAFDGLTLTIGEPTVKQSGRRLDAGPEKLPMPVYKAFENNEIIGCTRTDTLDTFDISDPRHLGNFLHDVMSHVRHRDDLVTSMRRQAYRYGLSDGQRSRLLHRLTAALDDPAASRWFEGFSRVVTERTISSTDRQRRPDRVVWTADGMVDVIDYKFGEQPPVADSEDESSTHRHYRRQVERYTDMLRKAGHDNVRGFIWYITDTDSHIVNV